MPSATLAACPAGDIVKPARALWWGKASGIFRQDQAPDRGEEQVPKPAWYAFIAMPRREPDVTQGDELRGMTDLPTVELRAGLDIGPPAVLAVGGGTAFPLTGWCYQAAGRTLSLDVAAQSPTSRCRGERFGSARATLGLTGTEAVS